MLLLGRTASKKRRFISSPLTNCIEISFKLVQQMSRIYCWVIFFFYTSFFPGRHKVMVPVKILILFKIRKIHAIWYFLCRGGVQSSLKSRPSSHPLTLPSIYITNWPSNFHKTLGHGFLLLMDIRTTPVWRQMSLGFQLLHILSSLEDQTAKKSVQLHKDRHNPSPPPPSPPLMTIC